MEEDGAAVALGVRRLKIQFGLARDVGVCRVQVVAAGVEWRVAGEGDESVVHNEGFA